MEGLRQDAIDLAIEAFAEELHGKAASVVDPFTGKHAPVFVRRIGEQGWSLHTSGSAEFARALEERLGFRKGEVRAMAEPVERKRLIYLAHASEDKAIARPLAEGLMAHGIEVWFDEWEIGYGDSLRRRMEQGLGNCTHFVVLLTATSVGKRWVNEEIDAGLMRAVEGQAKFIGLRHELALAALSPFLKTRLTPELAPGDLGIKALADEIYGISRKPPLGEKPRYVQTHDAGSTWSTAARVVAEFFVRKSENAEPHDPEATYEEIVAETGLSMPDVRIGALDLVGAGLLERRDYIGSEAHVWPKPDLFVTFDSGLMSWDPEADGRDLAVRIFNLGEDHASASELAAGLGWPARRFNVAAAYLIGARAVKPVEYYDGGNFWPPAFDSGDDLLRFVRSL